MTPTPPGSAPVADTDAAWMRQALDLARLGEGLTRPNPPVGAVVVRDGQKVGGGWHRRAGTPHAEVHALAEAGDAARGATLYVTLEPCTTTGRTPPCTDAILRAGIRRVVFAVADPNPKHAGRAVEVLRARGVEVSWGVCADEAADLLAPFACTMLRNRPRWRLKLALTLDGRLADTKNASRWLTGPASRERVQAMRRRADVVAVGAGTLRADDPSLWPRPDERRAPWRLVVAGNAPLPIAGRLFNDEHADRTLVALPRAPSPDEAALAARGVQLLELPPAHDAFWPALDAALLGLGAMEVLCEGGGRLANSLLRAGRVDELDLFYAPKLVGDGVPAFGGVPWPLAEAPAFDLRRLERLGDDFLAVLLPRSPTPPQEPPCLPG